jgi:transglutaminase-like putative cysteine protease
VERVTWRLEVKHVTVYRYDRPVVASYNEARVTPLTTPGQIVIDSRVSVKPAAGMFAYWDYWGALVHSFDVHDPHQSLRVTSSSLVETGLGEDALLERTPKEPPPSWSQLGGEELADAFYEFLAPSSLVSPSDLADVAGSLREGCGSPDDAVPVALEWASSQLEYAHGATDVGTSALDAWRAGRGVCQDFSHLALAVLRALGIPARYVSGYFYPKEEGALGAKVMGESHAWVEAWTGDWRGWDPTNRVKAGQRHVIVARGRDYADVAPLKGIFSGPPGSSTDVTVELTRRA